MSDGSDDIKALSLSRIKSCFSRDRFAEYIGVEILDASPGSCRAKMKIEDHHLNSVDLVHGAAIFGLADLVFAVASNSHGTVALGINVSVSYIKSARGGTLYAHAEEVSRNSKLGIYSMQVTNEENETLALMTGTVYRKKDEIPALKK